MEDLGHQPEVLGGLALSESDLSLMNLHQVRNQLECSHPQESSRKREAYRAYLSQRYRPARLDLHECGIIG